MESQWQQERMPAPPQPASSSKAARCRASSAWAAWICAESSQSWRPRSSAEASSSWRRGGWAMPQLYRKSVRQSGGARGDAPVTWAWDGSGSRRLSCWSVVGSGKRSANPVANPRSSGDPILYDPAGRVAARDGDPVAGTGAETVIAAPAIAEVVSEASVAVGLGGTMSGAALASAAGTVMDELS